MKIAIFGRITQRMDFKLVQEFFEFLQAEGIEYFVDKSYANEMSHRLGRWDELIGPFIKTKENVLSDYDFAYSFGGDGTLLNTVTTVGPSEVPILGVNFGRLGFLTNVRAQDLISTTKELTKDIYKVDVRSVMTIESNPGGLFGKANFGLNDLTIHKSRSNEMITVHTYINGEFLNSYWGDGLIIATATGSTAYSLSCGGPIIIPQATDFVITPVAPHSLTVRPIIIPDDYVVSFEIESRAGQAMVSLDTRTELVAEKTEIAVKKADFNIKLVRPGKSNYLNSLRDRLMWGRDTRN